MGIIPEQMISSVFAARGLTIDSLHRSQCL